MRRIARDDETDRRQLAERKLSRPLEGVSRRELLRKLRFRRRKGDRPGIGLLARTGRTIRLPRLAPTLRPGFMPTRTRSRMLLAAALAVGSLRGWLGLSRFRGESSHETFGRTTAKPGPCHGREHQVDGEPET